MSEVINKNLIFEKVQSIVEEVLNINKEQIKLESKIIQDLGAESLDVLTLLMELEDHFKRKIPDDAALNLVTIKDVVDYIAETSST
jgi:acyl carrier protein